MKKWMVMCLLAMSVGLAGCGSSSNKTPDGMDNAPAFSQFSDIPIPDPATMELERTILFGMQEEWLGKMTFITPYPVGKVFDFYISEMNKFGWREIAVVRMHASTLNYERAARMASITVSPLSSEKTEVVITMMPRKQNAAASTLEKNIQQKPVVPIQSQTIAPIKK